MDQRSRAGSGWTEGWFEMFWQVPLAARAESLFEDPGFGATNTKLAQQAGVAVRPRDLR